MDDLDAKLIAELRINGRASVPELAQLLGVARATAQKRLDRLVAGGHIKGFTVRLRDDVGSDGIRAVMLIEMRASPLRPTIAAIKRMPGVANLSNTNGVWDLIAELQVTTLPELNQVIATIRALEGVGESETFIMLGPA